MKTTQLSKQAIPALEVQTVKRGGVLIRATDYQDGSKSFFRPSEVASVQPRRDVKDREVSCVRLKEGRWVNVEMPTEQVVAVVFETN